MEEYRCPHCGSKIFGITATSDTFLCLDCGHQFKIDECSLVDDSTFDNHNIQALDKEQANPMSYEKGAYKICPSCGMKIPIAARKCPFCKNMSIVDAATDTAKGCLFYIIFWIVGMGVFLLILSAIFG